MQQEVIFNINTAVLSERMVTFNVHTSYYYYLLLLLLFLTVSTPQQFARSQSLLVDP